MDKLKFIIMPTQIAFMAGNNNNFIKPAHPDFKKIGMYLHSCQYNTRVEPIVLEVDDKGHLYQDSLRVQNETSRYIEQAHRQKHVASLTYAPPSLKHIPLLSTEPTLAELQTFLQSNFVSSENDTFSPPGRFLDAYNSKIIEINNGDLYHLISSAQGFFILHQDSKTNKPMLLACCSLDEGATFREELYSSLLPGIEHADFKLRHEYKSIEADKERFSNASGMWKIVQPTPWLPTVNIVFKYSLKMNSSGDIIYSDNINDTPMESALKERILYPERIATLIESEKKEFNIQCGLALMDGQPLPVPRNIVGLEKVGLSNMEHIELNKDAYSMG
jgi:hypothetical protein